MGVGIDCGNRLWLRWELALFVVMGYGRDGVGVGIDCGNRPWLI